MVYFVVNELFVKIFGMRVLSRIIKIEPTGFQFVHVEYEFEGKVYSAKIECYGFFKFKEGDSIEIFIAIPGKSKSAYLVGKYANLIIYFVIGAAFFMVAKYFPR